MHVEKPERDRGEGRREPAQRQNTTWGTGIITRPTETAFFLLSQTKWRRLIYGQPASVWNK